MASFIGNKGIGHGKMICGGRKTVPHHHLFGLKKKKKKGDGERKSVPHVLALLGMSFSL
jgi:hypothetical protein